MQARPVTRTLYDTATQSARACRASASRMGCEGLAQRLSGPAPSCTSAARQGEDAA
jgi:hypothetical protein